MLVSTATATVNLPRAVSPMDLNRPMIAAMNRTQALAEEYEHTGARFIIAELDLAITFCQIGLTSRITSRADRNAGNAERALEAVTRMRERIRPNRAEQREIAEKSSLLQSLLEELKARLASTR